VAFRCKNELLTRGLGVLSGRVILGFIQDGRKQRSLGDCVSGGGGRFHWTFYLGSVLFGSVVFWRAVFMPASGFNCFEEGSAGFG